MTDEVLVFGILGPAACSAPNRPRAMNAMNPALLAKLDRRLAARKSQATMARA